MTIAELVDLIHSRAAQARGRRFMVALAGPPAAGKSTLAADLARRLAPEARVVPMDGFHYDDAVLIARGLRHRKGAPETFDAAGLAHLLARLRVEEEVAIPLFDRSLEISRAGADIVTGADRILIVEGNYLLLNRAPWLGLRDHFDLTVKLEVAEDVLTRRLTDRWRDHGKSDADARAWIEGNDLPNALTVIRHSGPADVILGNA